MNLGLVGGEVYLVLFIGGEQKTYMIGEGRHFDDNYWHEISIKRSVTEVRKAVRSSVVFVFPKKKFPT